MLEITENLPRGFLILLARFRNGCTISGVKYLILVGQRDCVLLSRDNLRDRAIEQAKRYHRQKLLEELRRLLICPTVTDKERKGILALAGFLGFPDFQNEIQTCWELANNKGEILPESIWASIQCSVSQSGQLLDSLLEYWDNLPPARIKSEDSCRSDATVGISFALERDIHDYVIRYLIS